MGMRLRCDELKAGFRFRLGEPTEGTFGRVYYEPIRDNMDELLYMLNEAQRVVTWLCYNANQTILETTTYLPVLSGVTRYTLPDRFLAPVSVFHRTYNQEYPVTRENLEEIRANTRSERYDYRYRYYEIRERVPRIAARGIVNEDSFTIIEDTDLEAVRVGDTCYNLTDNSQAEVEAVSPALERITIDGLSGGEVNRFQKGDVYQIDMREATCDAMDFWPKVTVGDTKQGYSGRYEDWTIQKDAVVRDVAAYISDFPSSYEDDERFIVEVYNHTTDEIVGNGAREGLDRGLNDFQFPDFFQLREDTRYSVRVVRADGGDTIDIDSILVTVKEDPESIAIKHASYPLPMEKDTDYFELPEFCIEATYVYAHILALKKQSRNPVTDPGLMAELRSWIADIKTHTYARDERGPHSVAAVGGNRDAGWPFPSNYGYSSVDILDLF